MPTTELQRWKCHKEVRAGRIVEIRDAGKTWVLGNGAKVEVSPELASRVKGLILSGYYVLYEDGYESWSPARAFETGYTKI